jgi:predicted RNA-binding Zn ribbon-like protein
MPEPLWLEFVNTIQADRGQPVDRISDAGRLAAWLDVSPRVATGVLTRAHALRGALRDQAERIAAGDRRVSAKTMAEINRVLKAAPSYTQLTPAGLRIVTTPTDSVAVLADIARSAAEFFATGDFALLKHCEGKGCVLLFYDTTKNHARRFCSADGCGNRYKAAARYERMKHRRAAPTINADAALPSDPA